MSAFTDRLAAVCLEEYTRWDNGAGRETHGKAGSPPDGGHAEDYYLFVKEYWVSIGNNNLNGRTVVGGIRPAWSSAFVSHCVKKAGAGTKFKYSEAHCHYIAVAMTAAAGGAPNYGYVARRTNQYKPQVGDIICAGREYAKRYDYDQANLIYQADSFYPSHGDIVVAVEADRVRVVGGNITHNVDVKRLALKSNGQLKDRMVNGTPAPWIAVLECVL